MFDLVLRGGLVHDGLGSPGVPADVAVEGDRVVRIGHDLGPARRIIGVDGLAVAPGFLDPHSHSDLVPFLDQPQPFKLRQGVTTEIIGNCGFSFAPLDEQAIDVAGDMFRELTGEVALQPRDFAAYLAAVEAAGPTNHLAALVGHNTLRITANGMAADLRDGALEEMRRLADASFAAGAIGLSSGLIYPPGCYGDTAELIALARVAHRWNRPYTTHMRNEDAALGVALDEAIDIARQARVRLQVSHCKVAGRAQHGNAAMLLDKLHAARMSGVDVRGDQYPYLAGGTFLSALLPGEAHVGGPEQLRVRLGDQASRAALGVIAEDATMSVNGGLWRQVEPADVLITKHATRPDAVGRTLGEVAGVQDPWTVLCDLLVADPGASMVLTMMAEHDVRTIMRDPLVGVGSDNGMPTEYGHPRTWGCFPRVLGEYVRELGVLSLPEAVRKMTSAVADQFGLVGRGFLAPGAVADIAVFDPVTVGHAGTYAAPDAPPTGIPYVVLAGSLVIDDGEFTGQRRGRVLRG